MPTDARDGEQPDAVALTVAEQRERAAAAIVVSDEEARELEAEWHAIARAWLARDWTTLATFDVLTEWDLYILSGDKVGRLPTDEERAALVMNDGLPYNPRDKFGGVTMTREAVVELLVPEFIALQGADPSTIYDAQEQFTKRRWERGGGNPPASPEDSAQDPWWADFCAPPFGELLQWVVERMYPELADPQHPDMIDMRARGGAINVTPIAESVLSELVTLTLNDARRQTREAIEEAARERERREAAERRQERRERRARGDRTVIPASVHGAWRPKDYGSKLAAVQRGDVDADPATVQALERAVTGRHVREFADLTVPQIRAFFAVFAAATDAGETDEGMRLREEFTVSAADLYKEAGINARQPKLCCDIVRALLQVSDRVMYLDVTWTDKQTGRERTRTVDGSMFTVQPEWAGGGNPERLNRWAAWRASGQRGPWSGPLPVAYAVRMSDLARLIHNPLAISRDTLRRLIDGAKQVRGKMTGLDLALFMEMTFKRQDKELEVVSKPDTPDVYSARAYVVRDKFLEDYIGAAELKKNRRRWEEAYKSSADVLVAGGLALSREYDRSARRGARDVFVPNPAVVLGVGPRAQRAYEAEQRKALKQLTSGGATEDTAADAASGEAQPVRRARKTARKPAGR